MVQKLALSLLVLIAAVAFGGLMFQINDSVTGGYSAGGGGRWYYGPQKIQLSPAEACLYSGLEPVYPLEVFTNEYGTQLSVCRLGTRLVAVPLVQTAIVR